MRPARQDAERAVLAFLEKEYPELAEEWRRRIGAESTDLTHDGEDGWSFGIAPDDLQASGYVGYVHADGEADDPPCWVEGLY